MYFETPEAFLALLILLPVAVLFRRSARRTGEIAATYDSHAPNRNFFRSRLALGLLFIAALVTVGARPYVAFEKTGSFLFLNDVSRSMHARHTCSEPTFLDRGKHIMRESLGAVPEASFGIVAFDRFAFPITQLTFDHEYLNEVIDNGLYVGLTYEATRTELANALGAVAAKIERLPDVFGRVGHVILLSDGNIEGDYRRKLREPIARLKSAGVRVFAVGIGNPEATPLTSVEAGRCSNRHLEVDGRKIMIPLRADVLKHIAGETLGQYFAETETNELIAALRAELRRDENRDAASGATTQRDVSWIFLAVATLALVALMVQRPGATAPEIEALEP